MDRYCQKTESKDIDMQSHTKKEMSAQYENRVGNSRNLCMAKSLTETDALTTPVENMDRYCQKQNLKT